jgi:predicted NBD/HSP70 family sugar kinase
MVEQASPAGSGSQSSLRAANAHRVLAVLRDGPATQADIARATSLSGATVSTIARDLLAAGAVTAVDTPGRGQQLRLAPGSGLTAGIAFGNHRVIVALGDLTSTVLGEVAVDLAAGLDAQEACAAALRGLDDLLAAAGVGRDTLVGVGVSVPALVPARGTAGHHPRWAGVDGRALLAELLPCAVHMDNDANLGARAESRWGELRGRSTAAWVKASTGIGLGLVLDGRVHRGAKGTAGELGHVSTDPQGPLCPCGNRGCLELSAALPALVQQHRASTGLDLSGPELVAAARRGEPAARRLVEDAGARIGEALAALVTLIDPERLVVGGDLAEAGDLLLDPLVAALRAHAMPAVVEGVSVAVTSLGDRAEVLGALALALDVAEPRMAKST